jgi:hypothetical protein
MAIYQCTHASGDESGIDADSHHQNDGWEIVGRAPIYTKPFMDNEHLTMLPAFNYEGIIAFDILAGSTTKERFVEFVNKHLVCHCGSRLLLDTYLHSGSPSKPIS